MINKTEREKFPSNREPLVIAKKLSKYFGATPAVDSIDFEVYPGEVMGFLGPNGAGKTTTIRMLLNLLTPTSGELHIFGRTYQNNRSEILKQMNSSSGTLTLPGKLSVRENLNVFADLYGLSNGKKRILALMERFDLEKLQNRPLYSLSTGQQVRVSLAKAFLNRPRLLLLDEPTSSLDPDVADRVRSFLMDMVEEEKTTVFITSHNMSEVERLCSRIIFLNKGKIQAEGSPTELAHKIKRWTINIKSKNSLPALNPHPNFPDIEIKISGDSASIEADADQIGPFLTQVIRNGLTIENISITKPTLEDFFVHIARRDDD